MRNVANHIPVITYHIFYKGTQPPTKHIFMRIKEILCPPNINFLRTHDF